MSPSNPGRNTSLTELTFVLDLALAPTHSAYRIPPIGQMHCYRTARVTVQSDTAILLRRSTLEPATDATGELDYGHIDTFGPVNGGDDDAWELTGDWGDALVRRPRVRILLDQTPVT
jgi:hypothetical protein